MDSGLSKGAECCSDAGVGLLLHTISVGFVMFVADFLAKAAQQGVWQRIMLRYQRYNDETRYGRGTR